MSKMALHESFGHLQPKLWAKEGSGVKLVVWLSTTKSQESTPSQRAIEECDMVLESSQRELQDWFRPRPDRKSGREIMMAQSPVSPNSDNFGISLWESQDKRAIWARARWNNTENIIWGKVVASPESRPWWVKWVQGRSWLVPTPKGCRMSSNQFVVGFRCRTV
jgi:hypothetical protein